MIILLEVIPAKSVRDGVEGVAEIAAGDTFFNYLWSYGPCIMSMLLSGYQASVDLTIRSRQPLKAICTDHGAAHPSSICLNLVDRLLPGTLMTEIRSRSFVALSATAASLLASLLPIFSASLYTIKSTQLSSTNQLHLLDSFAPYLGKQDRVSQWGLIAPPLILAKNMSYPAFTYNDLVLPRLALQRPFPGNQTGKVPLPPTVLFNVTARIPALRPRLDCRFYDSSMVTFRVEYNSALLT
jgi:hypothetical protein